MTALHTFAALPSVSIRMLRAVFPIHGCAGSIEAMRVALLDVAGQCRGNGRRACPMIDKLVAR